MPPKKKSAKNGNVVTIVEAPRKTSLLKIFACVSGIYFFYLYYGIFQESIYRPSKVDGSKFRYTYFLLLIQCAVNALMAAIGMVTCGNTDRKGDSKTEDAAKVTQKSIWKPAKGAPSYLKRIFGEKMTGNAWMAVISFTYVFAMGCSNMALQYVNYPTQALGKSCKMIPIMLFNVIFNKTRYTKLEYVAALLITCGIVVFRVFKSSSKSAGGSNSMFGLVLLLLSLGLDGLTSSNQKTYRKEFSRPTFSGALQMMLHTNLWAIVHMGVFAFLSNDLFEGLAYVTAHDELLLPIVKFSLCSAFGQLFIFLTITGPGPLACTTITTTRKFFTILISVMTHSDNKLTGEQWGGVAMVFGGLGMKLGQEALERGKTKTKIA